MPHFPTFTNKPRGGETCHMPLCEHDHKDNNTSEKTLSPKPLQNRSVILRIFAIAKDYFMSIARIFLLPAAVILLAMGCKKANSSSPMEALQPYMKQMAGIWPLTGTETDSTQGATYAAKETYQIRVVDSTTISFVTNDLSSINCNYNYLADTNRYLVSVNVVSREIVFASKWFSANAQDKYYSADVFDTVIYNYADKTVAEHEYVVENGAIDLFNLKSR